MTATKNSTGLRFVLFCLLNHIALSDEFDYGFVIDAGSTGSRIYTFQWLPRVTHSSPPESKPREVGETLQLGAISVITSLDSAKDLLIPLIEHVKDITKSESERWSEFPLYLKATAGMRLLASEDRVNIFTYIRQVFNDVSINPFLFEDSYAIIASGTEEAVFDWLSVNYVANTLETDNAMDTIGALDLGGASTQIAFTPIYSSDIIDSFISVNPFEDTFRLFGVSHLGYGTVEMERLIAAKVYKENNNENPCLLRGTNKTYDYIRINYTQIYNVQQTGIADSNTIKICEQYIHDLLYLDEHQCLFDNGDECSINGQYLPNIPSDMKWIAFSAYAYNVFDSGLASNATLAELYEVSTNVICNYTLDELNVAIPGLYLPTSLCLLDLYIVVLLRDAYGFDVNKRNILWTNDINGQSAGWQWGSILYDANLLDYTYICNKTNGALIVEQKDEDEGDNNELETYKALAIVFIVLFSIALVVNIVQTVMILKNHDREKGRGSVIDATSNLI